MSVDPVVAGAGAPDAAAPPRVPFSASLVNVPGTAAAEGEKIVHFIRHGQGYHNLAYSRTKDPEEYKNWDWVDSRLTEEGQSQARTLRPVMAEERIDVVLVSTLSRAIVTGLLACPEDKPFEATELIRERIGTHPCDKRRSRTELAADFPTVALDALSEEEDPHWTPEREPWPDLVSRAHQFLEMVFKRPEEHIVCVAHNDFFQALFRDSGWHAGEDVTSILFKNCDKHTLALRKL